MFGFIYAVMKIIFDVFTAVYDTVAYESDQVGMVNVCLCCVTCFDFRFPRYVF